MKDMSWSSPLPHEAQKNNALAKLPVMDEAQRHATAKLAAVESFGTSELSIHIDSVLLNGISSHQISHSTSLTSLARFMKAIDSIGHNPLLGAMPHKESDRLIVSIALRSTKKRTRESTLDNASFDDRVGATRAGKDGTTTSQVIYHESPLASALKGHINNLRDSPPNPDERGRPITKEEWDRFLAFGCELSHMRGPCGEEVIDVCALNFSSGSASTLPEQCARRSPAVTMVCKVAAGAVVPIKSIIDIASRNGVVDGMVTLDTSRLGDFGAAGSETRVAATTIAHLPTIALLFTLVQ